MTGPVYSTVQMGPELGSFEQRAIEEFSPGFEGIPYITWILFLGLATTTVFLALIFDQAFVRKAGGMI